MCLTLAIHPLLPSVSTPEGQFPLQALEGASLCTREHAHMRGQFTLLGLSRLLPNWA